MIDFLSDNSDLLIRYAIDPFSFEIAYKMPHDFTISLRLNPGIWHVLLHLNIKRRLRSQILKILLLNINIQLANRWYIILFTDSNFGFSKLPKIICKRGGTCCSHVYFQCFWIFKSIGFISKLKSLTFSQKLILSD